MKPIVPAYAAMFAMGLGWGAPLSAALPEPVRAMIDAAKATGDEQKVRTVIDLARQTNPDDDAELDAMLNAFEAELAIKAALAAEAQEAEIRSAGFFDNWTGKGEFGAFQATGNTSNTGVATSLNITREGINWQHRLTGRVDFQRANSETTREQFLARYEPNLKISESLFVYALAQYERDRFQGFSARYAVSGGVGYNAVRSDNINLSLKAGPAYRVTEFVDGRSDSRLAALVGVDFDWSITDSLKLTQNTNAVAETGGSAIAIIDSRNTTLELITGLNAALSKKLSARISYAIEYASNPPPGAVQTDTLTRMTLIYDF